MTLLTSETLQCLRLAHALPGCFGGGPRLGDDDSPVIVRHGGGSGGGGGDDTDDEQAAPIPPGLVGLKNLGACCLRTVRFAVQLHTGLRSGRMVHCHDVCCALRTWTTKVITIEAEHAAHVYPLGAGNTCFINAAVQCLRHTPGLALTVLPDLLSMLPISDSEPPTPKAGATDAGGR